MTTANPLKQSISITLASRVRSFNLRGEMPVNMAELFEINMAQRLFQRKTGSPVEEPRAGVIGEEANGYFVTVVAHTDYVAANGILKIVRAALSAAYN